MDLVLEIGGVPGRGKQGFVLAQDLREDEFVAGRHKGFGGLFFAEPVDGEPGLPDPGGQAGEIAVAGNDAEAVQLFAVEQVHGVDDHGAVRGVFPEGIGKLLDGLDGVGKQPVLPSPQPGVGPVAVDPFDCGGAVFGDLGHEPVDNGRLRVVRVDEHRQSVGVVHKAPLTPPPGPLP